VTARPPQVTVLHLGRISSKAARDLLRHAATAPAPVPIVRHDGTRIGAVISADLAQLLDEAFANPAAGPPSGLLEGQTDPVMRAKLQGLSRRLRAQYGGH